METQVFERELKEKTLFAEQTLKKYLPAEEGLQGKLAEAMNYSLLAGGKRLRPILMRETCRMCGGSDETAALGAFMAAIEMIHTYSLVHDDLPAMDNDRYRRGRETTWYVYGDAMGILAGDGLLNYAFETAAGALRSYSRETDLSVEERISGMERISEALFVLAGKAGMYGMIGGQAVDVMDSLADKALGQKSEKASAASENGADSEDETAAEERLLFIHAHKTAALIEASMMAGAILAGASAQDVKKIEKCAYNVGIAFQIQDDILDVVGDSKELGKATGSDAENHKKTYVALKGLDRAREDVETLSQEAAAIIDSFEGEHDFLKQLILTLIHRRR